MLHAFPYAFSKCLFIDLIALKVILCTGASVVAVCHRVPHLMPFYLKIFSFFLFDHLIQMNAAQPACSGCFPQVSNLCPIFKVLFSVT